MKKYYTLYSIIVCIAIAIFSSISYDTISYSSGPPAGRCGAPADGNATCTACHNSFAIIDLGNNNGWITSNIPAGGYTPGATYTITATATQNGINKFGFQMSPQATNGTYLGTMVVTDAVQTQIVSTKYIEHKSAGTSGTNSKTWSFNWIAPSAGTGAVTFYACFNAANNNGAPSGDQIYKTTYTINECVVSASISASATTICSNDIAFLNAQGTGTYLWSNGATTQNIATSVGGNYTVTVTNGAGCSAVSSPLNLTVIELPPSPVINAPTVACVGAPVTINISNYSSANNYMWSLAGGTITGQTNGTFSVVWNNAGDFNYNVAATLGDCGSLPSSSTISVGNAPSISLSGIPPISCAGNCYPFTVAGASNITVNGVAANSGDSLCAIGTGEYTIVASSANGCSISSNFQFEIDYGPGVGVAVNTTSICLNDPSQYASIQWIFNGDVIATNEDCITPTASGDYTVIVSNANGCTAFINQFFNYVGIEMIQKESVCYNNPFNHSLHIKQKNIAMHITITDISGRIMAQFSGGDEMMLNTSTWPDGIYLARLADSNESAVIRLVKQTQ